MPAKNWFIHGLLAVFLINPIGICRSQTSEEARFRVHIVDVGRTIHKNLLGVPRTVDCTVTWEVYERRGDEWASSSISNFDAYRALCLPEGTSEDVLTSDSIEDNFWTFSGLKVGAEYKFVVEGHQSGQEVVASDTARILAGRQLRAAVPGANIRWYNWVPFNGRIPLAFFGRGYIFDGATRPGKIAFHLIWNFWIAGFGIWLFYCVRHLSLRRVFPMENRIHLGGSYDSVYKRGISQEFTDIINSWRELVDRANEHMRGSLDKGNQMSVEEMERENIEFWREEGVKRIKELLERTNNPRLDRFPAVRIIRAGLENHQFGGYRWLEVSKEVDRAIENRASSEMEKLRRSSYLDWLWNLGTLAPLVGLFGTATGISHAFVTLIMLRGDITQTTLVRRLAEGIFEALWTTIEGLFVGILLMLLYYFYHNKLNWIYSKWEEIYVHVSERL